MPSAELVRLHMYATCGSQDKLLSRTMPRCLCSVTMVRGSSELGKNRGESGGDDDMYMASVLATFGRNFQVVIQLMMLLVPTCISRVSWAGEGAEQRRPVSSAKRLTPGVTEGRSFTYSKKSRGPRIEPWGTPET